MSMHQLPSEMLRSVFQNVNSQDIPKLRSVCQMVRFGLFKRKYPFMKRNTRWLYFKPYKIWGLWRKLDLNFWLASNHHYHLSYSRSYPKLFFFQFNSVIKENYCYLPRVAYLVKIYSVNGEIMIANMKSGDINGSTQVRSFNHSYVSSGLECRGNPKPKTKKKTYQKLWMPQFFSYSLIVTHSIRFHPTEAHFRFNFTPTTSVYQFCEVVIKIVLFYYHFYFFVNETCTLTILCRQSS